MSRMVRRGLQEFLTILDWGCGCGRVARHALRDRPSGSRLIGVDIDEEALQWCRKHLPNGEFRRVPSLPPSGLPPQSVDLVYAYSVVTHLDEKTQDRWLEELHRIAKPGAPVLLTVLSERALVELNPTVGRRWLARWRRVGIDWASRNAGLDAILGENESTGTRTILHDTSALSGCVGSKSSDSSRAFTTTKAWSCCELASVGTGWRVITIAGGILR